jgi:hypothetical protein
MSAKPKLVLKWLKSEQEETKLASEANFLLISPDPKASLITVGGYGKLENTLSALTFAQDMYRFGRYNHPMTDMEHDIHVYSWITPDMVYQEGAGMVGPASPFGTGSDWWIVDLVKSGNQMVLRPSYCVDPIDHQD